VRVRRTFGGSGCQRSVEVSSEGAIVSDSTIEPTLSTNSQRHSGVAVGPARDAGTTRCEIINTGRGVQPQADLLAAGGTCLLRVPRSTWRDDLRGVNDAGLAFRGDLNGRTLPTRTGAAAPLRPGSRAGLRSMVSFGSQADVGVLSITTGPGLPFVSRVHATATRMRSTVGACDLTPGRCETGLIDVVYPCHECGRWTEVHYVYEANTPIATSGSALVPGPHGIVMTTEKEAQGSPGLSR